MGLFSAPRRLARHVTISLPVRWHSERTLTGALRRSLAHRPGPDRYVDTWRWFVASWPATAVALVVSIFALLAGLLFSSRFGL